MEKYLHTKNDLPLFFWRGFSSLALPGNLPHILALQNITSLLDAAENKVAIVETIFSRSFPSGWAGSLADILEVRSEAFADLLNHVSPEVREIARTKLSLLNRSIRENREREAEEYNRREQRFE